MDDVRLVGTSETLNGWKDIAIFLGKSVRSVQRWERDLGLPVHRINTPDRGQIVYARRAEIEAWRRQMESPPPAEPIAASAEALHVRQDPPPAPVPGDARGPVDARTLRYLAVTLLILAALGIGVLIGLQLARQAGFSQAARLEYQGTELQERPSDGLVAWRPDSGELASGKLSREPRHR